MGTKCALTEWKTHAIRKASKAISYHPITSPSPLLANRFPFQIDVDGLWNRAQPVTLAQAPALALSPEDLLLHLCLHTAKHAPYMSIRMFFDIAEVVRRYGAGLNWDEIGARARQWGILRAVYVILRLTQELLDMAIPADWLASLQPAGFEERYLTHVRQQIFAPRSDRNMISSNHVAHLWALKGYGRKLALIRDRLLLSRESMAGMYPAPANSWRIYLYYPMRWKDVLAHHSAMLWRLARGDLKTRAAVRNSAMDDWMMSG